MDSTARGVRPLADDEGTVVDPLALARATASMKRAEPTGRAPVPLRRSASRSQASRAAPRPVSPRQSGPREARHATASKASVNRPTVDLRTPRPAPPKPRDRSSYVAAVLLLLAAAVVLFMGPPELPSAAPETLTTASPAPEAGPVPGMPRIVQQPGHRARAKGSAGAPTSAPPTAKNEPPGDAARPTSADGAPPRSAPPAAGSPPATKPAAAPAPTPAKSEPAPPPQSARPAKPTELERAFAKAGGTGDLSQLDAAAARLKRTSGADPAAADSSRGAGRAESVGGAWAATKKSDAPDVSLAERDAHVVSGGERRRERGSISQDTLKKVLAGLEPQVRACWEKASGPGRSGRVKADVAIAASGKVTSVDTSASTLKSGAVRGCIERVVASRAKFSAIGAPAAVEYYWDFAAD